MATSSRKTYDQQLLALARTLVNFHETERSHRRQRFGELRGQLDPHFQGWLLLSAIRDARRTFRRAAKVFVREGGGLRAWFWFKRKQYWQWAVLAPAGAFVLFIAANGAMGHLFPGLGLIIAILGVLRERS